MSHEGQEIPQEGPGFRLTPPDFSQIPEQSMESESLVIPERAVEIPRGRRAGNAARKAGQVLGQVAQEHIDTSRQNIATEE